MTANFSVKSPALSQRLSRLFWRGAAKKSSSSRGMVATQEKVVDLLKFGKPLHLQSPQKARKTYLMLDKFLSGNEAIMAEVADYWVATDGEAIKARVYKTSAAKQKSDNPCLVYFHGGGVVIGDINTHDKFCREVAARTDFVVVSVDYRLAPEFTFPVPVEDAIRGWNWACGNADMLGIDLAKTGVGGDSAGGYLATSVCQQAVNPSLAVNPVGVPAYQWLVYPMLDCRLETASTQSCTEQMVLTRDTMAYFFDHFLPRSVDRSDVVVSPGLNKNLASLPKTYLSTAGFDPLEDEGRAYAEALRAEGVEITEDHFADVMHGFIGMTGVCPSSARYVEQMVKNLVKLVV